MGKLSNMTKATTLNGTDLLYTVQNGEDKAVPFNVLREAIQSTSQDYYGMIIHQNTANPAQNVEYIGINKDFTPMIMGQDGAVSYGSWSSMPTIVKNVPAMVKTNGTVDYYLNPDDYTKKMQGGDSDVSNTAYDGNALSWFEPIWVRIKAIGDDLEVRFAYSKLDDDYIEVCPAGCGVWLPMFYGSVVNGKMRSIAGTNVCGNTTGNTDTATQYASITANGSNYLFFGGKLHIAITLLHYMWFKGTNSELWGRGNDSGYSASAADGRYGTKSNPVVGGGQFYCTSDAHTANKSLHSLVINTYDVWLRDPYTLTVNNEFKLSTDYTYDVSGANYEATGLFAPVQGYIKLMTPYKGFLVPKATGGSTDTYFCDHFWINTSGARVALRSGHCNNGRYDGASALSCYLAASGVNWNVGCALILKTPV